jgi:AcrR family transcriptional regulator
MFDTPTLLDSQTAYDGKMKLRQGSSEPDSVFTRPVKPDRVSPSLSQRSIVDACIRVLDNEGAKALTMRRVANELGAHASSLYWYVKRREDLIDLSLDEILRGATTSPARRGTWHEEALATATCLYEALASHPWAPTFAATRPLLGPNALELFRRLLTSLASTGADPLAQSRAASTISDFTLGSALAATSARAAGLDVSDSPLAHLVSRQVGSVAPLPPGVANWQPSFAFGIGVVLDGLAPHLGQEAPSTQ